MKRIILIAGMGTSPAVLTVTVWALAHLKKPVIPDEIVVLSTKSGHDKLVSDVFSGKRSVWDRMVAALASEGLSVEGKLLCGEASMKIVADRNHNFADDLRSAEDNLSAADSMLGEIRKYTGDPNTVVYASIAGGRKTMSALLFSCMSLLAREDDKVLHVLIPQEYEGRLSPTFYFPERGVRHIVNGSGKKVQSSKVSIELFEVPFVRVRGWFQEKFRDMPPSYRDLVKQVQKVAPPAVTIPDVEINAWNASVRINGVEIRPGAMEFAALLMLASGVSNVEEMYKRLYKLRHQTKTGGCDWIERIVGSTKFSAPFDEDQKNACQEVSKVMSQLRKSIATGGVLGMDSLVPMRGRAVSYPTEKIKWRSKDMLTDICGYLIKPLARDADV